MDRSKCSAQMIAELGISSIDNLFEDIPQEVRIPGLKLPAGMSELELIREMERVLSANQPASRWLSFLGAGVYHHFIPAAVKTVISRSEFITSYTPYQPEISQGMLQAQFEYQSFMTELTSVDYMNCSVYDVSTAIGEAILMSHRIARGKRFLMSRSVSPERKEVARLYAKGADIEIVEVAYAPETGQVDISDLESKMSGDVIGFYFETPNFFGPLETGWKGIRDVLGEKTMVVGINPLALALVKPPGEMGADIVVGDAQVFGVPMSYGGPSIGIFGCKADHVRKMPGRLIGMTEDAEGRRSFCMTLQTREQHIRRSKATSNICTNEALLAVAVATHLAVLGRTGLRRIALRNLENMRSLSKRIDAVDGFDAPVFDAPHFNEFAVRSDVPAESIRKNLLDKRIHGGVSLDRWFPELKDCALYATTEMHSQTDHDRLLTALEGVR
ncbi:MAG TPA: aminomethyl-transferring glycine dehydrogenase subunit GcvPA [Thermoplasmata archaeon]|nr:aminomethyl-transferring glycine dehydrogenase subunit GcvPA [Thermoplasmata archaeon]